MKVQTSPLLLPIAILFSLYDMTNGLTSDTQCLDTEDLLEISYKVPNAYIDAETVTISVTTSIPTQNNETTYEYSYHSNDTFSFQSCITKESMCANVKVFGPPKDSYKIAWNGQVLDKTGPELEWDWFGIKNYLTATEFGDNCVPQCHNDEGLFEIQYRTTNYWSTNEPYLVEDQKGNKIISYEKERLLGKYLHIERHCLPKNECYKFIMGDGYAMGTARRHNEHASISFDGKVLFESKSWFYESFDFGGGCPSTSFCDPENDSMLELFVSLKDSSSRRLSWKWMIHKKSGSEILRNMTWPTNGIERLHHEKLCVPKGSCLSFSLISPTNDADGTWAHYELSMDKTIYRKDNFWPDSVTSPSENPYVTYLGDCVEVKDSVCGSSPDKELLELNFHTYSIGSDPSFPHLPSSDTRSWKSWFIAGKEVIQDSNQGVVSSNDFFHDYELDSSYRVLQCISNEDCIDSLFVHEKADFAYYSIKLNGVLSTSDAVIVTSKQITSVASSYEVSLIDDGCELRSGIDEKLTCESSAGTTTTSSRVSFATLCAAFIGALVTL